MSIYPKYHNVVPLLKVEVSQLTKDKKLLEFFTKSRYQTWMIPKDDSFNKIFLQCIYEPAKNSIKHFEESCYQSSIVVCGAVAEMLTYFLFFVHTNSNEILDGNSDITHSHYSRITQSNCKVDIIKTAFGNKGKQTDRIEILRKSKITKTDYGKSGEGHDIEKICKNLDKLHEIRIKYFHHWLYEEKGNVIEDARNCIKFLYEAIGDIFECDDDKQSGVLFVNKRILDWINKSSNDKA